MKPITYLSILLTTVTFGATLPALERSLASKDVSTVKPNGIQLPRFDGSLHERDDAKLPDDDDDDDDLIELFRRADNSLEERDEAKDPDDETEEIWVEFADKRDEAKSPDDDDDDDEWIELTRHAKDSLNERDEAKSPDNDDDGEEDLIELLRRSDDDEECIELSRRADEGEDENCCGDNRPWWVVFPGKERV